MQIIKDEKLNLSDFKMGHIIVHKMTSPNYFGNEIRKEQVKEGFDKWKCDYVHVGVSIGGPYSIDAVMPKSGVFDITEKFKGRTIKLMKLKGISTEQHKKIAVWAATRCNLRYGWFSLLYFKMEKIFGNMNILATINRPFCSFLTGWAVNRELVGYFEKHIENLMPADFLDEERFETVWEGVIS